VSAQAPAKWANVTLTGEDEPLLEGTTWTHSQTFSGAGITTVSTDTYEFRAGGRMVWRHKFTSSDGYNDESTGSDMTWQRDGNNIRIIGNGGFYLLEGTYYSATQRIMLTAENSRGEKWDETWEPQQGSSIATAPAPQTVYVQPSAPAQSPTPAPAPVPSTPTFQTGTYGWSNSGQNMTMNFSAGIVTTQLNNRQIWYGTYRINGTQLVISVTNSISDYSRLLGVTYSYTITSNTSFSGSGETWVRTGY
jgi:hypothetical protein